MSENIANEFLQKIALLKLQLGQGYLDLFNIFKSHKIYLPPPKYPLANRQEQRSDKKTTEPTSQHGAFNQLTSIETNTTPSELNHPSSCVPPLSLCTDST